MTENEIHRLAHAMNDLRPDWPISSLTTFLKKTELARWTYRDATVAMAWVATDTKLDGTPASETPKRVLEAGPWRKAVVIENPQLTHRNPPKRQEECRQHPGEWPAPNCRPCATEGRALEPDPADTPPTPEPDPALPGPARVRAALRAAKGAVGGE